MKSLYGNYDSTKQVSVAPTPTSAIRESSFFKEREQVLVRPYFVATAVEGDGAKLFLLTYGTPADQGDFSCHACAPVIGGFAFERTAGQWTLTASNKAAVVFGQWGYPARARLARIGPRHYGLELWDTFEGQGETTVVMALVVPWLDSFDKALSRWMADDNGGMCGPDDLPCYKNHKQMKFVRGDNPAYYDVLLTLSGTELTEGEPYGLRRVAGTERLRFSNGKYVQLYRTGDITVYERAAQASPFYK